MRNRTATLPPRTEIADVRSWYRQPVAWLGLLLFAASLAGCVLMIVLGARHADQPLPTAGGEVAHMPLARPSAAADPPQATR